MPHDPTVRIGHMLDAARDALEFCRGLSEADFRNDPRTHKAVIPCLTVIGEAARHVTPEAQEQIPDQPWSRIVGLGNRVVYGYYDIDQSLIWQVVQDDLPPPIDALSRWLKEQA